MNDNKLYIKNYDEVITTLAELLKKFKIDLNGYQTDVYLNFDAKTKTATVDTYEFSAFPFIDIDSQNDLIIYSDAPHCEHVYSFFNSFTDFAEGLELSENELFEKVKSYYNLREDAVICRWQIIECTYHDEDMMKKLKSAYVKKYVTDCEEVYLEKAKSLLTIFINEKLIGIK